MTDQEQNIAIAEACGWHLEKKSYGVPVWVGPNMQIIGHGQHPPSFTTDLNAIYEATGVFDNAQKEMFIHNLMGVCLSQSRAVYGMASTDTFTALWLATYATAKQRAQAFLMTVGKWEDSTSERSQAI